MMHIDIPLITPKLGGDRKFSPLKPEFRYAEFPYKQLILYLDIDTPW